MEMFLPVVTIVVMLAIIPLIVCVSVVSDHIPINYAKRVVGRHAVADGQHTFQLR